MRFAAIDLGTNSFLCLIAEVNNENSTNNNPIILSDEIEIVRLGEGLYESDQPLFSKAALERANVCLKKFAKKCEDLGVEKIQAVATAAARTATNSSELIEICKNNNINLKIIDGLEEARLTFLGSIGNEGGSLEEKDSIENSMVIDIGGGSTEVLTFENNKIISHSFDFGAVKITDKFKLNNDLANISLAKSYLEEEFKQKQLAYNSKNIIAVAGTPTTIAQCDLGLDIFAEEKIDGYKINEDTLKLWLSKFSVPIEERKKIIGLNPKRADIILAGTLILSCFMQVYKYKSLVVSTKGLRYGLIKDMIYGY